MSFIIVKNEPDVKYEVEVKVEEKNEYEKVNTNEEIIEELHIKKEEIDLGYDEIIICEEENETAVDRDTDNTDCYICDICDKSFPNKIDLEKHILNYDEQHKCASCNFTTHHKHILKSHMISCRHNAYLDCSYCDYRTIFASDLKYHVNTKHSKKVNASKQTGAGTDKMYVPTLWYYDALNFLGSRSEPCRITPESIEDEEGSNSSDEDIPSQQIGSIASTSRRHSVKKKKETLLQKQEKIMKSAEVMLSNKEEEDWEIFGKSVGLQLKDISGTQLIFTQKIISDVIYNAKLERLSEDSCLLVSSSEIRRTLNRYNYQIPFIQSPVSSFSSPSPYNRQSPNLPHKRPSSRNYPSPTPSPSSSSTTQYHPSPHYSQSPRYQSQLDQSPQHTIQFPQQAFQSSQQAIQSPQHIIQSAQHSFHNNPEDFLEYIKNHSGSTIEVKGSANLMKDFLIFKPIKK